MLVSDTRLRALAPASLLALTGLLALTPAAPAAPLLPDLVADAAVQSRAPEVYTDAQGQRLLLRMDGYVHNAGAGALEIQASGNVGGTMTAVAQMLYDSDPAVAPSVASSPIAPRVIFETADGHNHFHLRDVMRYSLWNDARTAQASPSQKVGFCLVDSEPVEAGSGATGVYRVTANNFCQQNNPTADSTFMGVSAGWRDWYSALLSYQWVDISDVAPGRYWLRTDADPDGVIVESNESNAPTYATAPSIVNGYLAQPVNAGTVGALSSTTVTLKSARYDDVWPASPGTVQYKIVTAPAKGTLDQPVGTWFTATSVRYKPRFGQSGADSFTFAARDGSSAFPRTARTAVASVTISGLFGATPAPATSTASAQTSRTAIPGAPEQSATQPSAAGSGSARPAPSVAAPAAPARGLSRILLARHRRSLIAAVTAGQAGRLRFVATRNGVELGRCSLLAQPAAAAVCKIALPRAVAPRALVCTIPRTTNLKLPGVRVTATLTAAGAVVARRSARPG